MYDLLEESYILKKYNFVFISFNDQVTFHAFKVLELSVKLVR